MTIRYGKGRRSRHNFMGICYIAYPHDSFYNDKNCEWFLDNWFGNDKYKKFLPTRREQSLKSIIRRVGKCDYPKGTRLVFTNWYCNYADVMIIV